MSITRLFHFSVFVVGLILILDFIDVTPEQIWQAGRNKLTAFSQDTEKLVSGEAVDAAQEDWRATVREKQAEKIERLQRSDGGKLDPMTLAEQQRLDEERRNIMARQMQALQDAQRLQEQMKQSAGAGGLEERMLQNIRRSAGDL